MKYFIRMFLKSHFPQVWIYLRVLTFVVVLSVVENTIGILSKLRFPPFSFHHFGRERNSKNHFGFVLSV
jgi:hypothetical protein